MSRHILLLRAVNLGSRNKVPMARLRELLTERGYTCVRSMLASGNVIVDSPSDGAAVAADVHGLIHDEWGLDIDVVHRTPAQLRAVVDADPIPGAAGDPKHYAVTFLARDADSAFDHLDPDAYGEERFVVRGSEVFAWYPTGIHDSRLAKALAHKRIGIIGTARNWDTVRALADLAERD